MPATLAIIALLANGLGLLFALLLPGSAGWRRWRDCGAGGGVLAVTAAPLLLALLSFLATRSSSGAASAWGVLVGALCGMAMLLIAGATTSSSPLQVGLLATAGAGPAALLLLCSDSPGGALLGCAGGGLLVALLGGARLRAQGGGEATAPGERSLELFALAQTLAVAAVLLAIEHFPHRGAASAISGGYWAVPPLLLGSGALAGILCHGVRENSLTARVPLLAGVGMAAAMLLITSLLQWKVLPELAWQLPLAGTLALGALLAVMMAEERLTGGTGFRPLLLTVGLLLLMFAVEIFAVRRLQGYGELLALLPLPALLGAVALRREAEKSLLTPALGLGALLVLLCFSASRLLLENGGRVYPLDFQRQYDALALLLGIAGTMGLLALRERGAAWEMPAGSWAPWRPLARPLLLAVLAGAGPCAVFILWGGRALLALTLGVAAGEILWMIMAAWMTGSDRARLLGAAPHLYLLIALLSALHFAPLGVDHPFSRSAKVAMVLLLIGATALLTLLDAFRRIPQPVAAETTSHTIERRKRARAR